MAALWNNPDFQFVFWSLVKIFVILNGMLGLVSYMIYAERKIAGHMQARTGPNRVGPLGLLQPIADVLKLFFKEEFMPAGANAVVFHLAPMLAVVPALVSFSVVPIGPNFLVTDLNVGLLLFLAMSSLGVYAITLGGWSSNNKYALLGGLRSSAQMISYELAMGLSTIGVLLLAGSLSLVEIVHAQAGAMRLGFGGTVTAATALGVLPVLLNRRLWLLTLVVLAAFGGLLWWLSVRFGPLALSLPRWYVFAQPLAFLIFMVTAFAETNRAPFDLPEAESELVAGFHVEYSSMKFGLFFLGEFANVITICSIAVTLFLGGWNGPWLPDSLKFLWFFAKLGALLFFFIWVRWTFPRLRYDQLMHFGWKVLLPLALVNIVVTAVWVYGVAHR